MSPTDAPRTLLDEAPPSEGDARRADASRIEEIDQLLDLAEQVSARVEALQELGGRLRTQMLLAVAAAYVVLGVLGWVVVRWPYASNQGRALAQIAGAVAGTAFGVMVLVYVRTRLATIQRARRTAEVEARILGDVVAIIHGLSPDTVARTSAVRQALISMRLRRIQYTTKRPV
jgi:hypothetical protein